MHMMKISAISIAVCLLLGILILCTSACGKEDHASGSEQDTQAGTVTRSETEGAAAESVITDNSGTAAVKEAGGSSTTVSPLPQTVSADSITDARVHAAFDGTDLSEDPDGHMLLSFELFSEVYYDAAELNQIKVGDLFFTGDGKEITVTSLETTETGEKKINSGAENGGITLWPEGGGVYVRKEADNDRSFYVSSGTVSLPLADSFLLTDDADLENRGRTCSAAELKNYLTEDILGFRPENTLVRIETGKIAEIQRFYTP